MYIIILEHELWSRYKRKANLDLFLSHSTVLGKNIGGKGANQRSSPNLKSFAMQLYQRHSLSTLTGWDWMIQWGFYCWAAHEEADHDEKPRDWIVRKTNLGFCISFVFLIDKCHVWSQASDTQVFTQCFHCSKLEKKGKGPVVICCRYMYKLYIHVHTMFYILNVCNYYITMYV